MDIKNLQRVVVDALEDVKAQDIRVFNTLALTALFDSVIIASGTSNRQTKALAASVRDKVKLAGGKVVSIEGEDTGEWVLVDLGDLIVHIMQPGIRTYYNLEELWGAKPVALKSIEGVKASRKIPAKTAPTKVATKKVAAKKGAANTVAAKKAPAKKAAPAKQAAPASKTAAKEVPAKKIPAKKATGSVAKKTPARKSTASPRAARPARSTG